MSLTMKRTLVPAPTEPILNLGVLGRPALAFTVYGDSKVTQGSHKYVGHQTKMTKAGPRSRAVIAHDAGPKLKAWRDAVAAAALARLPHDWQTISGAVVMDVVVSVQRNADTPKTLRTVPKTKPDLDKLLRAINDGLGTTLPQVDLKHRQVFEEDSRITSYRRLDKVWVADPLDPDSLRRPGAVVRLWRYPTHLLGKVTAPVAPEADVWWESLSVEDREFIRSLAAKEAAL